MTLGKYLYFVKKLNETSGVFSEQFHPVFLSKPHQDKKIIGRVKRPAFEYCFRELSLLFRPVSDNLDFRVKNKVRFVNLYNKLLFKILSSLIQKQSAYFNSGNIYDLVVLSQKEIADNLMVSQTWIHHIIKGKNILTPHDKNLPLIDLFFKKGKWIKLRLEGILGREKNEAPFTDSAIQKQMFLKYGYKISIRAICNYRNFLFIPAWHKRKRCKVINSVIDFSSEYLLARANFNKYLPGEPGVYVFKKENKYIYIGSSCNLKKRVKNHLYNGSKNKKLRRYICSNKCTFQFALLNKKWKEIERRLYQDFIKIHGSPPLFNKMTP